MKLLEITEGARQIYKSWDNAKLKSSLNTNFNWLDFEALPEDADLNLRTLTNTISRKKYNSSRYQKFRGVFCSGTPIPEADRATETPSQDSTALESLRLLSGREWLSRVTEPLCSNRTNSKGLLSLACHWGRHNEPHLTSSVVLSEKNLNLNYSFQSWKWLYRESNLSILNIY